MRRSLPALGVWKTLWEELRKIPTVMQFHAAKSVDAATEVYGSMKTGTMHETQEMAEKRKQHREAYETIMRQQQEQAQREKEEKLRGMSFMQRLKMKAAAATEALKEATSTNAGAMSLLQHCAASHAAEVAVEEGIDVRSVTMCVEKKKKNAKDGAQVGHERVVVGYIDAPNVSEEKVMVFAEKLQKRCPVANAMEGRIEWRSVNSDSANSNTTNGTSSIDYIDGEQRDSEKTAAEYKIPQGTPGSLRFKAATAKGLNDNMRDDDELHPVGKRRGEGEQRDR